MQHEETPNLHDLAANALDWWREAGIDHAYVDEPQVWLADLEDKTSAAKPVARLAPVQEVQSAPAGPVHMGGEPGTWPQNLEDFARWWLTEPTLDPAPAARRVPPIGAAQADLMVLVPMPEEGDEAVLLSGRAGKLLDAMLAAMGLSRDRIYLAAALPARAPAPDWATLAEQGLRNVLLHHIALARPKRLLILGKSVVSTLAGNDPAKNGQNLSTIRHGDQSLPAGSGYDLEAMLARPSLKSGVWKKWLEWTSSDG